MTAPAAPAKLSLADQALINLCGYLACRSPFMAEMAPDWEGWALDQLARLLPEASSQIEVMARLVLAAQHFLHRRGDAEWLTNHARVDLRDRLAEVMKWRAVQAVAAIGAQAESKMGVAG